ARGAGRVRRVDAGTGIETSAQAVDMKSVVYMMWKEVLELRQDPRIFSIAFLAPILRLAILSCAPTPDVRSVPVAVVDSDRTAPDLVEQKLRSGAAGRRPSPPGIDPRLRVWFNPTIESRYFMLPGIFALLLLVVTSNLSSMAIVREREVGTLEQLNVTPLGRVQLVLGKLLPYGAIGMIDAMIVLLVIVFWLQVPLRGSFWLLFG